MLGQRGGAEESKEPMGANYQSDSTIWCDYRRVYSTCLGINFFSTRQAEIVCDALLGCLIRSCPMNEVKDKILDCIVMW